MGFININFKIVGKPIVKFKYFVKCKTSKKSKTKQIKVDSEVDFVALKQQKNRSKRKRKKRKDEKEITSSNPQAINPNITKPINPLSSFMLPEEKKPFTKHVVLYLNKKDILELLQFLNFFLLVVQTPEKKKRMTLVKEKRKNYIFAFSFIQFVTQ